MSTAIVVKYLGPTNTKGSRWKAMIEPGGSNSKHTTVPYDYSLDAAQNAEAVASAFAKAIGHQGKFYASGSTDTGEHYFVPAFPLSSEVSNEGSPNGVWWFVLKKSSQGFSVKFMNPARTKSSDSDTRTVKTPYDSANDGIRAALAALEYTMKRANIGGTFVLAYVSPGVYVAVRTKPHGEPIKL
jgi:hypothetical protein